MDNISAVELKDFIARALADIIQGVQDAQVNLKENGVSVNPQLSTQQGVLHDQKRLVSIKGQLVQMVEFDVAVTATSATGTKGSIGVVAGIFALGSQGQSNQENKSLSRLKFSIPVTLPYGDKMHA